jgi:4-amino-4-deoxy-L-arabinose transferase-like glycosyltransferase
MYHALAWSSASNRIARWWHPFAVVLFFVLGFMTKFVAALFLPAVLAAMMAFAGWRARVREDWRPWLAALAVGAALAAPWFVYQNAVRGEEFWHVLLAEHVYKRMTGFLEAAHVRPWHFYLTALRAELANSKTIVPVLCGMLVLAVATVRRRWVAGALVLAWFIIPMSAISAGTSKLYHYTYPFLPPLALAAGFLIALLLDRERSSATAGGPARLSLARGLEYLRARIPAFSAIAAALGIACLLIAGATLVNGRLAIQVGETSVLRNSSVVRPALIGASLLLMSRPLYSREILMLLVLAALPLDKYLETLRMLDDGRAPMGTLGQCLSEAAAGTRRAVYLQTDGFGPWQHVYYLRGVGWEHPADRPIEALPHKLFSTEEPQPVLLTEDDYMRLERSLASNAATGAVENLHSTAAVRLDGGRLLLLPGAYATCASSWVNER